MMSNAGSALLVTRAALKRAALRSARGSPNAAARRVGHHSAVAQGFSPARYLSSPSIQGLRDDVFAIVPGAPNHERRVQPGQRS